MTKLSTLVYLHTLDAHIMYYLKISGNWNHINKLSTSNRIYLSKSNIIIIIIRRRNLYSALFRICSNALNVLKLLDVEATICQFLKYINTQINMTADTKCKICDKNEIGD